MADPTERELLAGLRAQCPRAGQWLVRLYYGSVYRFLATLGCDTHRAEDLTQDTFAAAWAALDGFEQQSSLRTWLLAIAYRKFVSDLRSRSRRAALTKALADREVRSGRSPRLPGGHSPSPLRDVLASERLAKLAEALGRLKASDRTILAAKYVEDLTSEQIGRVVGKPAGTVRSRIHIALRRLREMLDGEVEP